MQIRHNPHPQLGDIDYSRLKEAEFIGYPWKQPSGLESDLSADIRKRSMEAYRFGKKAASSGDERCPFIDAAGSFSYHSVWWYRGWYSVKPGPWMLQEFLDGIGEKLPPAQMDTGDYEDMMAAVDIYTNLVDGNT